ncbi:hypothetical protein SK128_015684 [Halocaridina rubra]|uniref:Uncharacterized protein n=1 Tax=Halocaridina rubra TaxID=373956 RepID=A0AAN8ZYR7_HALRR
MEDYKADFIKYGKEKGAEKYTQHLENLTPLLSAFANSTLTIFKMQDHLGRDLKRATNYDWNVDYYNEIAKKVLSKTPVLLWDSTLPLADMYQEECRVHKRSTPDTGDWQCQDYSHIGFIMVDQYLDMLLNHVCSNATRETSAKS